MTIDFYNLKSLVDTSIYYNKLSYIDNVFKCLNIDYDVTDENGNSIIHYACSENKPNILKSFIRNGANINIQDNNGETALHFAVYKCNGNIIDILLKNGADPFISNDFGYTPFEVAFMYGVDYLIKLFK